MVILVNIEQYGRQNELNARQSGSVLTQPILQLVARGPTQLSTQHIDRQLGTIYSKNLPLPLSSNISLNSSSLHTQSPPTKTRARSRGLITNSLPPTNNKILRGQQTHLSQASKKKKTNLYHSPFLSSIL